MAMTVRFTDDQTSALRARAEAENRSMHQVVIAAVEEYLTRAADNDETSDLAAEGAARYRALLDRLGE